MSIQDKNPWIDLLENDEMELYHAITASLDEGFAREERAFYITRNDAELEALTVQAWNCCDATQYQVSRSHLALRRARAAAPEAERDSSRFSILRKLTESEKQLHARAEVKRRRR